jgi:DNA polymerase-3 subunit beta
MESVMEFSIKTDELAKGLYCAQGIVEKKTAMPILSNVLIQASKEGKVSISATNLEVGMMSEHQAEVISAGSIAISARHAYDIVRSLPTGSVKIKKLESLWAEVRCEKIEYRMLGMATEDFQALPEVGSVAVFKVNQADLRDMIEKTIYAVSSDETRYNLNGSFLEKIGGDAFRMVSTDGHRLSMLDARLAEDPKTARFGEGIIIPKKGLLEIKRLLDTEGGDCFLGVEGNNLIFRMSTVMVVMRLLDGRFPEYRHVVPEKQKIKLRLNRKVFGDSLRRISILSNDRTLGLKLKLSKNLLQVTTSNPDVGEAREDLVVEYGGKELVVGFNARYLLDALSTIETEEVDVSLDDDLSPCVLHPTDCTTYTCVIMPMRI